MHGRTTQRATVEDDPVGHHDVVGVESGTSSDNRAESEAVEQTVRQRLLQRPRQICRWVFWELWHVSFVDGSVDEAASGKRRCSRTGVAGCF